MLITKNLLTEDGGQEMAEIYIVLSKHWSMIFLN